MADAHVSSSGATSRGVPPRRRSFVRPLVILGIVIALLFGLVAGIRVVIHDAEWAPVTRSLTDQARDLQTLAVQARVGDPKGTGPTARQALQTALSAQQRATVLGTSTLSDGRIQVSVSLWTDLDTGQISFTTHTAAKACVRVLVSPGVPAGGYHGNGTVTVLPLPCPAGVTLSGVPDDAPWTPESLPEMRVRADVVYVPPQRQACLSGSRTCN